jgi:UV DNA damage endonuclease
LSKLSAICQGNGLALLAALKFCHDQGIGCFRINSQIMPLRTHPDVGYRVEDLPNARTIVDGFRACGEFAAKHRLRITFHPDQFVVLSSPHPSVLRSSLDEIEYQAEVAEWVGADVITIHGGGAYGDKTAAINRLRRNLDRLSSRARRRLSIENDDKIYTPADLLPLCQTEGIPLVYDVHQPERHHDFIDAKDFPKCWRGLDLTVEVEAKAKEVAVLRLAKQLAEH